ncbi:hypothetical protein CTI12_AA212910 [Artemisia annua]|uniref:Uncharacterized protein n=1 Tax=Artemisia annua TaxID=35608 RepID=A0A2U1NXW5_ARTAN|nr:hypothetical protein CTI12_AA212910 [Artemisia annua]
MAEATQILPKTRSWSPDYNRNKEWERLKIKQRRRFVHRSTSHDLTSGYDVTDEDIKELTACFELGFGFNTNSELDPKLKQAFPALELYAAVNQQISKRDLSRSSSMGSDSNSNKYLRLIANTNEDSKNVKLRLKKWAQVVACSVREASKQPKMIKVVE